MAIKPDQKNLPCGRPNPRFGAAGSHHDSHSGGHESSGQGKGEKKHGSGAEICSHPTALERYETKLQSFLDEKGLKQSSQRSRIMRFLMLLPGHFTVQDIARDIQEDAPGIGAATIYRNIKTLVEAGILRETLVDQDGQMVYELLDDDHHDHIVCLDCHQIFEFHEEGIETHQRKIAAKMGFTETQHRHVIYAHCDFKKAKGV